MRIKIFYPSGENAIVNAKLVKVGPMSASTFGVALEITELSRVLGTRLNRGEVLMVDPRSVCVDTDTDKIIYNGREHHDELPADFQQWMGQHPEWPGVLELKG